MQLTGQGVPDAIIVSITSSDPDINTYMDKVPEDMVR
jgi:hypothetical protein